MMPTVRLAAGRFAIPLILAAAALSGCGGGGDDSGSSNPPPPPPATYTIGGNVSGLTGTVVLQNNAGNNITVVANTAFTFSTAVNSGGAYAVTILTQPAGQTCSVANGAGSAAANVTNVAVTCATNPPTTVTVGGTITGLTGTVVLQNNAGNNLSLTANGAFTFTTAINSGSAYAVAVLTQPAGHTCAVTNGSGAANANVTNVAVACTLNQYALVANVSGLSGTLVLQEAQDEDSIAMTTNGFHPFNSRRPHGSTYAVSVYKQPAGQNCLVTSGSGTALFNTSINVTCSSNPHAVSGTITGLNSQISLQLNLGEILTLSPGDTTFAFPKHLANNASYVVSIVPSIAVTQGCGVTNGSGTATANVTNVQLSCGGSQSTFRVGGIVQGITGGQQVELQINGGESLTTAGGVYFFPTFLATNTEYLVNVKTQPPGQYCIVTNAGGLASPASGSSVRVSCSNTVPSEFHSVGGTITGLKAPFRLYLDKNNALLPIAPSAGAPVQFEFPVDLPFDEDFRVLLSTQPAGQTCVIPHNGSIVGHVDITNINVVCVDNVTDSLSGTFTKFADSMAITFYPGGIYVFASVDDDTSCGPTQGSGVEMGAYDYDAAAGTLRIVSNALDTNGSNCGIWENGASSVNGALAKTGSGQDQVLVLSGGGLDVPQVLVPVPSVPGQLFGSYGRGDWSFFVFSPGGRYLEVNANNDAAIGEPAGIESGCYSTTGTVSSGALTVVTPCAGSVDTDDMAGLSSLGGALPYTAQGSYAVSFDSGAITGFRLVPLN